MEQQSIIENGQEWDVLQIHPAETAEPKLRHNYEDIIYTDRSKL